MNAHTPVNSLPSAGDNGYGQTLASRAIIVRLIMKEWSGRRLDQEVTDEINSAKGANADAGRYNKLLLPKEEMDSISKVISDTRAEFNGFTSPWLDKGGRIMDASIFIDKGRWLARQESKMMDEVDKFIARYPSLVAAAPNRLSGLFKDTDYPSVTDLRKRYSMTVIPLPVPTAQDFRVSMSEAQASQIRATIERQVNDAAVAAVRHTYQRVADAVGHMAERLKSYKPAQKKGDKTEGVFKDGLVENIRGLIDVLPGLNITGDRELAAMADRLRPLVEWDAKVLRKDEGKRADIAAEAQKIFDKVSDFLA